MEFKSRARVVPIVYAAVHPGYWLGKRQENKYCASSWTSDADVAQEAADADAFLESKKYVKHFKQLFVPDGGDQKALRSYLKRLEVEDPQFDDTVVDYVRRIKAGGSDAEALEYALAALISADVLDWTIGVPAKCAYTKWAVILGRPLPYSSTMIRFREYAVDVSPLAAGGIAWSPNAYFSLFGALSVSRARPSISGGSDNSDDQLVAPFGEVSILALELAVGGNIDLLGLLY